MPHDAYFMCNTVALLPTGKKINPRRPERSTYYDQRQVAFVLRRAYGGSKTVVATSFGSLDEGWSVGTIHRVRHDQTLRDLGSYEVVGTVDFSSDHETGEVPDRALPHWVFK